MIGLIFKGGLLMVPIILCSILALAIVIERFYHLNRAKINTDEFMDEIRQSINAQGVPQAVNLCNQTPGPVAHVVKAGITASDTSRDGIKRAIEEAGLHEIPRLEKRVGFLSTIAHITPLLGLLGTVTGMVRCFQTIQQKSMSLGSVNPADLAGGIWEALITTVAGLIVAIPTLVAYNYIVSIINDFVLKMQMAGTEVMNIFEKDQRLKTKD